MFGLSVDQMIGPFRVTYTLILPILRTKKGVSQPSTLISRMFICSVVVHYFWIVTILTPLCSIFQHYTE